MESHQRCNAIAMSKHGRREDDECDRGCQARVEASITA